MICSYRWPFRSFTAIRRYQRSRQITDSRWQSIYGPLDRGMNDVATTLLLEVCTQRNFVADFFRLSTKVEFYWQKQQNRVLCHPLGDLWVTYTVHLWLVGKRVVDFLLVLIEVFSPALTVEALWEDIGKNVVFVNFRGKGVAPTNDSWRQRTRVPGLSRGVICIILRLAVLMQYRRVTHRQTDYHSLPRRYPCH